MQKDIITTLHDEFIPYASELLLNNLPSIDGLLPVHRKVLWALYENRVFHNKPFIKMLRAGSMSMIYYVLGDMPLYKAMTNMGNNGINYYYLDPKGSYGDKRKRDGVGASPRYIECRLSEYSEDMLKNIDKNSVPTKRNFDNTKDEVIVLPSMIPNILTNLSQSVAVGEASKIPAHCLTDVCDGISNYIKNNNIEKTIDIIKCPDMSLGGQIIYNKATFNKIYKTGRGSFTIIGKYTYDEKKNKLSIYEIPYETYIEDIEDKLRLAYEKGLFKEITDIQDVSGRQGIQLDIYLKKNTNIELFVKKLRKYTPYESKFSCNFTLLDLDWKTPKLMALQDIIEKWIQHRINCITNELNFDIDKHNKELNKLFGLEIINRDLDKAIALIRKSSSEKEAIQKLINEFNLNDSQAEYISTIRLVNINHDWINKRIKDIDDIKIKLEQLKLTVSDENKIKEIIIQQLEEVKKKYGKPRLTEIIYEDDIHELPQDIHIEDFNCKILITKEGYCKKLLRATDSQKLKDGDEVLSITDSNNKDDLLFISNQGNCYKLKCHELNEHKPSQLGEYLPNLLSLEQGEEIVFVASTSDYKGNLIFVFENGKIAKVTLSSYETKTNRSKLKNAINTDSKLVRGIHIQREIDIVLVSDTNYVLVFNTSNLESKATKSTQGNQIMKSKKINKVSNVKLLDEVVLEDIEYYKSTTGKAGKQLKDGDSLSK